MKVEVYKDGDFANGVPPESIMIELEGNEPMLCLAGLTDPEWRVAVDGYRAKFTKAFYHTWDIPPRIVFYFE